MLEAVVTQNIDTLHRKAGSRTVVEVHGTIETGSCWDCKAGYPAGGGGRDVRRATAWPAARCGGAVKPDVVLFGEMLPEQAMEEAYALCAGADLLLCVGTSLEVYPGRRAAGGDAPRGRRRSRSSRWARRPTTREAEVRLGGRRGRRARGAAARAVSRRRDAHRGRARRRRLAAGGVRLPGRPREPLAAGGPLRRGADARAAARGRAGARRHSQDEGSAGPRAHGPHACRGGDAGNVDRGHGVRGQAHRGARALDAHPVPRGNAGAARGDRRAAGRAGGGAAGRGRAPVARAPVRLDPGDAGAARARGAVRTRPRSGAGARRARATRPGRPAPRPGPATARRSELPVPACSPRRASPPPWPSAASASVAARVTSAASTSRPWSRSSRARSSSSSLGRPAGRRPDSMPAISSCGDSIRRRVRRFARSSGITIAVAPGALHDLVARAVAEPHPLDVGGDQVADVRVLRGDAVGRDGVVDQLECLLHLVRGGIPATHCQRSQPAAALGVREGLGGDHHRARDRHRLRSGRTRFDAARGGARAGGCVVARAAPGTPPRRRPRRRARASGSGRQPARAGRGSRARRTGRAARVRTWATRPTWASLERCPAASAASLDRVLRRLRPDDRVLDVRQAVDEAVPLVAGQQPARLAAEPLVGAEQRPPADVDVVGMVAHRDRVGRRSPAAR